MFVEDKYLFVVAQKALIKKDGKILILKIGKKAPTYPEHWDLPGGKLEHGEDFKEGLEREVSEETTLNVKYKTQVFAYLEKALYPAYLSVVECDYVSGEVELSFEHLEYKWVKLEEILNEEKIEPYLKAFLENN